MSTFTRVNTNQLLGPSDERGDAVDYGLGDRWYETDTGLSFEVAWDATMEKKVWREGTSQKPVVMDGDFVLFLNSTTGNDKNDGLTPAKPIKTIAEWQKRRPAIWRGKCRANFAPGTYIVPSTSGEFNFEYQCGHPDGPRGEPEIWNGQLETVATVTATGGTNDTITYDGSLPDGFLRGAIAHVVSGDNEGFYDGTVSNVGNTITIRFGGENPFLAGDVIEFQRPSVTILADTTTEGIIFNGDRRGNIDSPALVLFQIKLEKFPGVIVQIQSTGMLFSRCEIFHHGSGIAVRGGAMVRVAPVAVEDLPFADTPDPAMYIHGLTTGRGGSFVFLEDSFAEVSNVIADDTAFAFYNGNYFIGGDLSNSPIFLSGGGASVITGPVIYGVTAASEYRFFIGGFDLRAALDVQDGHRMTQPSDAENGNIHDNDLPSAVLVDTMSQASLLGIIGTGNTGVGITVQNSSKAMIDGATSVTGTGGDIDLDGTPHTYADVAAGAGNALSDNRLNVIFVKH